MDPRDRLDQLAAPDPVGRRYDRPPRDSGAAAPEVRALRQAKVTQANLEDGWNADVLANPIRGGVVRTTRVLTLKATSQPDADLSGDPWSQVSRVGFAHIAVNDVVGYVPFGRAEREASGYDGVIVPHAGDFGAADTGAILSAVPVGAEITHFWGTITAGAGPTYAWTGDPGYSGAAAIEVNGVTGLAPGSRVRMFDYQGEGSEPWFEYDPLGAGAEYTGGPGIDVTGFKISFDYDALQGLGVEGAGDAAVAVVKLTADKGLQFTAVTGGIEIIPNPLKGVGVDGDGVAVKLEAEATSSLAFSETGEVAHAPQAATLGVGVPTGISGENLAYCEEEPSALFDANGHYNPSAANLVMHTPPEANAYTASDLQHGQSIDANGHVRWMWSHVEGKIGPSV